MSGRPNARLAAALLAVPLVFVYGTRLQHSPIYLTHDEVIYTLNAYSIASSGHDLNGRLLPLYFHITGNFWATPIHIYLTALFLRFLPVSETTTRLPSVLIGLTDMLLMYFVAKRMFKRELLALVAAAVLALTPAHFIHSRLGVDHLSGAVRPGMAAVPHDVYGAQAPLAPVRGTCALGFGVYSYAASFIMMPIYFALTLFFVRRVRAAGKTVADRGDCAAGRRAASVLSVLRRLPPRGVVVVQAFRPAVIAFAILPFPTKATAELAEHAERINMGRPEGLHYDRHGLHE